MTTQRLGLIMHGVARYGSNLQSALASKEYSGIMLDMICHWPCVLDNLFGQVQADSCLEATHVAQRWDEAGKPYEANADDAADASFQLKGPQGEPIVAQVNSSWVTRVRRDDLVTFHIDGTQGSALVGLTDCRAQSQVNTPRPVWNPRASMDRRAGVARAFVRMTIR